MDLELFDTHTHLDVAEFEADQTEVIERAVAGGVTRFLTVGASNGFDSNFAAIELASKYDFIWASVGIHPHDAALDLDIDRLRQLALQPKVQAIGETGLDFYRNWSPREKQEAWFSAQIELAIELDKPLIIHSREAGAECLQTLIQHDAKRVGGVFHCYAEDAPFAEKLREINFMISLPGTITFKNAEGLRQAVREIPLEQIMLETDAPYLAPTPYRGKRCESAFMLETAKVLAEIKDKTLEEIAQITTTNAFKFFKLDA